MLFECSNANCIVYIYKMPTKRLLIFCFIILLYIMLADDICLFP